MNCIYRIECLNKDIKEFYIGSTENLAQRIRLHKSNSKRLNTKLYKFIRNNGGLSKWKFIIEVDTPNYEKDERLELEQYYKDLLEPQLNSFNVVGLEKEKRNNIIKKHNNLKGNCPKCNKLMIKGNISRHIKQSCKSV